MDALLTAIMAQRRREEPETTAYANAIAAAGSSISTANRAAVNAFISGCKTDGIWSAIKASCLLAGPDSLAGALVPLVGPAPTNFNFVSGDHSRTTGLVGDGSTKGLRTNYNHATAPQDDRSAWVWLSVPGGTSTSRYLDDGSGAAGGGTHLRVAGSSITTRCASVSIDDNKISPPTGLFGVSRGSSASYIRRVLGGSATITDASQSPATQDMVIFARGAAGNPSSEYSVARIGAYGCGEALDLALLDARLATYMAALS